MGIPRLLTITSTIAIATATAFGMVAAGPAHAKARLAPPPTAQSGPSIPGPAGNPVWARPSTQRSSAVLSWVSCGATRSDAAVAANLAGAMTYSRMGQQLTAEQAACARRIVAASRAGGLDRKAAEIAVMTAMVETTLRDYNGGDLDSVGLFQQRNSWGTYAQRINPESATAKFLSVMQQIYPGNTWLTAPAGQVAAAVQRPAAAYRGEYALAQSSADALLDVLWPLPALHSLTPSRLLDTRNGTGGTTGAVAPGHTVTLKIRGAGGVASNATAVVLNLTVTKPTGSGYLTAYPYGGTRPTASNLNFTPGVTRANLAVVPIGANGDITLYNGSNGSVQLVADAFGYNSTATGSKFTTTSPVRVLDTRNGTSAHGPVAAGATVNLQITGQHGVPTGATAVVLNVTATTPKDSGYLTAWPSGTRQPPVSNLNFTRGQTIPNLVIVPIGSNGKVSIRNSSAGTVQLIADQFGYYAPTAATSFTATTPGRLLDTRTGTGAPKAAVGASHTLRVKVSGVDGIPAGIKAIVLNVTETSPTSHGYVTVYPDGIARPTASNLNFTKQLTAPNLVLVPVSPSGYIDLYNGSTGSVHLIADCFGFYR